MIATAPPAEIDRRVAVPEADDRPKVLILAHDARAPGGVNNFLRVMRVNVRGRVVATRFANGPRYKGGRGIAAAWRMFKDYLRFALLLRRRHFDLLHINPSLDNSSTPRELLFSVICGIIRPKAGQLVFYRGWSWSTLSVISKSTWRRWIFLRAHRNIDHILLLSESFRRALITLGLPPNKLSLGTTMFEGQALAPFLDQKAKEPVILFLSRFLPAKGGAELLDAFAAIHKDFPDWTVVMAGDGPDRSRLEERCYALGLCERVEFTGYVKVRDKMAMLARASLFVLPTSHGEGMPNALLEAMAAGQVIISTAVGGIPNVVQDGVNGTILETPDSQAITRALRQYMTDAGLCERIGAHNRDVAWRTYEAGIVSSDIAALYESVIAARAQPQRAARAASAA